MNLNNSISDKYSDDFIQRFWAKVIISSEDDCWEWQNALQSKGYGSVSVGTGITALAHKVAFELENGEIPEGSLVCHRCDNPTFILSSFLKKII